MIRDFLGRDESVHGARTRNFFVKAWVSIPSIPELNSPDTGQERSALQLLTMGKFTNHEARGGAAKLDILSIYRTSVSG